MLEAVLAEIRTAMKPDGLNEKDIVIITGTALERDFFYNLTPSEFSFGRWEDRTSTVIACETVKRAKGIEANFVILATLNQDIRDSEMYVGASRARLNLVIIGPESDIPAPDVNTNSQTMAWMMDTYSMHVGYTVPGVVTGKPIALGGSKGRNEATARGAVICVREAAAKIGLSLKGATVVVQGYGNAGSIAAKLISELGAKVIAVSDSSGGIHNAAGLDLAAVGAHKKKTGSVVGLAGTTAVSSQAILEISCDVLIPAALENQITAENAAKIKTKIVAEAANGPTTPEADEILFANGALVIPDILCNAGGVTVSYFEWVQGLNRDFWEEEEVNLRLEKKMVRAFHEVYDMAQEQKSHLRTGAYLLSVKRVADAMSVRGIYP